MKLELCKINKSFSGKHILKDVSFAVEGGRAMGFLGRNGAGKTTTLRALMDVFRPDSGEFLLNGETFKRDDVKIGYMPEERGLYQDIDIITQLTYIGMLKKMESSSARQAAMSWLERMELGDYAKSKLSTLSKGNQQKVQIIQAIINDPDIAVFDEPFSGLDPVNAQVLKEIIREFIDKGRIVIFSSHQMGYVEEFCDDVSFIKDGRIILAGSLDEVKKNLGQNRIRISSDDNQRLESILFQEREELAISELDRDKKSIIVRLEDGGQSNKLVQKLIGRGLTVESFGPYRPSLEEIFIRLDKEDEDARA